MSLPFSLTRLRRLSTKDSRSIVRWTLLCLQVLESMKEQLTVQLRDKLPAAGGPGGGGSFGLL